MTTKIINKLFKKKIEDRIQTHKTAGLVATHRCNMNCSFCIWKKDLTWMKEDLDIDLNLLIPLFKQMKEFNYSLIALTGGECGLHPKFKELIQMIVDFGFDYTIVTNGRNLDLYKFIFEDTKLNEKFDSLAISLDGSEETHDSKRGKGSYKKILEAIDFFKSKGKCLSLKCAIGKSNYNDFMHVLKIGFEKEVNVEVFDMIDSPETLNSKEHEEVISLIEKNEKTIDEYLKKINISFRLLPFIEGYGFCGSLSGLNFDILPNGKISMCCGQDYDEFIISDLRDEDFFEKIFFNKKEKVKTILSGLVDIHSDPLSQGILAQDRCSFCRVFLNCKKNNGNVSVVYPEEVLKEMEKQK